MAEDSNISVDHLQFSCSICLDLLKDPVTTSCGHSFCMACINDFWNQPLQKGMYSCPQCRETFMPRPVLRRNNVMAEVVEKLKWKDLSGAFPTPYSSESEDVECDICSESKEKAVRSCLGCMASFCKIHLKPHYESPVFKKHKLIPACKQLQEKVCARHDKLIDFYCRTDQTIICALCMLDEHKGHNMSSIASERNEKQKQIRDMRRNSHQKILEKEKKLQDLKQTVNTLKNSSQAAVEECERVFTELLLFIEEKCYEVTKLVRAQEKAELDQAAVLQEQLEQEIAELRKRDIELELLSDTDDHVYFLQRFQTVCSTSKAKDLPRMTINQQISFDGVRKCFSDLKEHFEEFCKDEFNKINPNVAKIQMILPCKPKTREEFLQYFCQLTLDPNTANEALWLSEDHRKVSRSGKLNPYPSHPERFDGYGQVLSKQSRFQFLSPKLETADSFKVAFNCQWSFENFKKSIIQLKEEIEDFCKEKVKNISENVTFDQIIVMPEPKTREEFLKYSCELSLDPNTANYYLGLSNDNMHVACEDKGFEYPDHPERFTVWHQVLCKQRLPLRSYWEAEVDGENGVSIAVSYKGINRKGSVKESRFGHNAQSWRLVRYPNKYCFWQNDTKIDVSGPISKRIGVYLDQKAGTLSFYSVSNKMNLIHKVTTTFIQPLYAGFGIGTGSCAKICLQVSAAITAADAVEYLKKK